MIYIDDPMTINLKFPNYCHLWSDANDMEELHKFAARIGLKRTWFQMTRGMSGEFPHYDISPGKRALALRYGAKYKPLKDWIAERMKEKTP